jgi:hypothetical protein
VSGEEFKGYLVKWDEDQTYTHNRANLVSITNIETGEVNLYNSLRDAEGITGIWRGTLKKYAENQEPYKGLKITVVKGKPANAGRNS